MIRKVTEEHMPGDDKFTHNNLSWIAGSGKEEKQMS